MKIVHLLRLSALLLFALVVSIVSYEAGCHDAGSLCSPASSSSALLLTDGAGASSGHLAVAPDEGPRGLGPWVGPSTPVEILRASPAMAAAVRCEERGAGAIVCGRVKLLELLAARAPSSGAPPPLY